ncbi:helix-turn-helix domain-containing protein [Paracoccus wurundjeri]|uniref:helix-turn-helix domain-containing protein n=1 Tax=Paracoccus onubensis TaxID=1675788 RepID=UPI00351D6121
MAESRLSIAIIVDHLGNADPAHFTRAFRACTGMTPNAYRVLHPDEPFVSPGSGSLKAHEKIARNPADDRCSRRLSR